MTIYLYVKTHKKTGLKYLGKTEQEDPHKYQGSGDYWKKHIKAHGYDVHTEILCECQSDEEVRQWGLYYSELWQVVASDNWANLKEEAGDGCTSEQARAIQKKRVEDGTHHWLGGENARQRIANGTHNFLGGEIQRQRVADGTHNFLGSEIQKQNALKRVADGTHHFLDGEISRKRVEDGTHNFLGGELQRQRVADGTHHLLGGELQRQRVADGTHHFQTQWSCPHCGKSGRGTTNFNRWHGDNCKNVS